MRRTINLALCLPLFGLGALYYATSASSADARGESPEQQRNRIERLTFGLLDDNKDGAISRTDLPELAQHFARLDRDGDERLNHAEFGPGISQILWSGGPGYEFTR